MRRPEADPPRLTQRQRAVLDCIRDALRRDGRPPTLREIGAEVGIRSTNGVSDHLKALEAKGYIDRSSGRSRGVRIIDLDSNGRTESPAAVHRIPVLGRIAAGLPIHADENVEQVIEVTTDLPGLSMDRGLFALRVSGESMIGDGIFDGDLIFVAPASTAKPGAIVVALIDDEATVKRYYPENGRIRLEASNPEMGPIHISREDGRAAVIQGIVVGVYRKI